jgi:transposase
VITGAERRRRWSEEQKRAIVAESLAPGAVISEVARRADIGPGQIYRWRKEFRAVVDGFAQVLIALPEIPAAQAAEGAESTGGRNTTGRNGELQFAGKVRVRIPGSVRAELAAAVVKALSRRIARLFMPRRMSV